VARVYVLGDSHTQALGPRLRELLSGDDVTYEAFQGHTTARATTKASIPSQVDVAVVALGGNDWGDRSSERAQLVRLLQGAGARVYWFGPATAERQDVDARHLRQTADQSEQLPRLGVRYFDSRPWTTTGHRDDGVHFTGTGYNYWASKIASSLAGADPAPAAGGAVGVAALVALGYLGWRIWRTR
jgi:lysophospholipase L1-like esterase